MQESDLLFPSVTGGFRSPSVLNKPFADVAETIGLGKRFTQCGLRRTFNDLARAAKVEAIVTRSISGHETDRTQEHYSTVHGSEQRDGISRVIALFGGEQSTRGGEHGGEHAPGGGEHTKKAG
jgi:integrase